MVSLRSAWALAANPRKKRFQSINYRLGTRMHHLLARRRTGFAPTIHPEFSRMIGRGWTPIYADKSTRKPIRVHRRPSAANHVFFQLAGNRHSFDSQPALNRHAACFRACPIAQNLRTLGWEVRCQQFFSFSWPGQAISARQLVSF